MTRACIYAYADQHPSVIVPSGHIFISLSASSVLKLKNVPRGVPDELLLDALVARWRSGIASTRRKGPDWQVTLHGNPWTAKGDLAFAARRIVVVLFQILGEAVRAPCPSVSFLFVLRAFRIRVPVIDQPYRSLLTNRDIITYQQCHPPASPQALQRSSSDAHLHSTPPISSVSPSPAHGGRYTSSTPPRS